jgi:hypothetical protein
VEQLVTELESLELCLTFALLSFWVLLKNWHDGSGLEWRVEKVGPVAQKMVRVLLPGCRASLLCFQWLNQCMSILSN